MIFKVVRTTINNWHDRRINVKEVKHYGWVIKLGTMNDLEKFIEKHGDVIIRAPQKKHSTIYTLEIYDDYRE